MATKHHDTFPATSRNNNLRGSVFWFLSRSTLLLGNAVSFRITMAITEGPKTVSRGCARLRVPKKIRKQISIICCWSWMGEMFGDFGWCHFRKSSEKHREQKRSSEETTNTRGKNIEISGWSTWEDVCKHGRQNPWSNHRAIHPKVCVRCVQRTAGKCWKNLKKWQKIAVLYVFLLSPRYLEKWSNLTSIFFKWVGSTTSERPFFVAEKQRCFKAATMMPWCHANLNLATFAVPKWMQQQVWVSDVVPARNVPQIYGDWTSKVSLRQPEKGGLRPSFWFHRDVGPWGT